MTNLTPLTRSLFVPLIAQSTPGVTPESRFLSHAGPAVVAGARAGGESAEKHPRLCPMAPRDAGIPPRRVAGGLLNQARPAMAIGRSGNQPARGGPGDLPALTWKERLSVVPTTTAVAGSRGRGEQLAGRRPGDLSVLTWSQSMNSQTRRGTAESRQSKMEKSTFLFLRWNWRLSRRPGIGAAASWCAPRNTNLVIRAAPHTGRCVTRSSMMLKLEMIIGGVSRETAEGQDTGGLPPPRML